MTPAAEKLRVYLRGLYAPQEVTITIRLPEHWHARLERRAAELGEAPEEVASVAVCAWLAESDFTE
jgi:hypothetical protein